MINLPAQLTEDVLVQGLRHSDSWLAALLNQSPCEVSFDQLQWVEPGGITPLASISANHSWEISKPKDKVYTYLQRMRFTQIFGLDDSFHFLEHDPTGRFISAIWIQKQEHIELVIREIKMILSQSQLEPGVQWAVAWSLNEFLGNVLIHSCAEIGGLVFAQVFPSRNIVQIAVCDPGIGITGSIRQWNPQWQGTDEMALKLALQQGWSSKKGSDGKGNGLYLVKQIIEHNGSINRLVLISGMAIAVVSENGTVYESTAVDWPGTSLSCTFDLSRRVDMEKILGHTDDLDDDEVWEVNEWL
ncbi:MAG: hypothetical protein OWR62_07685 [Sulfobacillus thermotolerans]|uniref:Histidine kinase/HSP90-like ATPase domain-containing protein n=1 Tax=Sulfobacillus thermotolerans TaxID=338644 RepID=A0ABM6RP79_9FIRM|nr:hypothetical protein BXT84_03790 [Sulfobacillus thermotolerans]MCY0908251.1 hypothetical protein [Sulfobacillus thermotolerans]